MLKRTNRILAFILIFCMLVFCVPNPINSVYAAGKVKLNMKNISMYIGQSKTLKLSGTSKKITWKTTNKNVVSVTKKGKITARKKGTSTIKAKVGRQVFKCKVKVKNRKNKIKYNTKVIKKELNKEKDYDVIEHGNNLTVNLPLDKNTKEIQNGDVIVLPSNEEVKGGLALKVSSVQQEENEVNISGKIPEIQDVFSEVKIAKTVSTKFKKIQVNKKYVQSVVTDNRKYTASKVTIGDGVKLNLVDEDIGNNGHISGSVEVKAPEITTDIDANLFGINKVNVNIENKAIAKVDIESHTSIKPIYLASIDYVPLGAGFYVDVVFYLCIDANGKATVKCTVTNNAGFDYSKSSGISPHCTFDKSFEGTKAEIDAKLLLNPEVRVKCLEIPIVGVELNVGPGLYAKTEAHDIKPFLCTSLEVYAYLDLGIISDDGIGKILKDMNIQTNWVLLDRNSENAIKVEYHFEDGKKVSECTYGKETKPKEEDKKSNPDTDYEDIPDLKPIVWGS